MGDDWNGLRDGYLEGCEGGWLGVWGGGDGAK